jgi:hypothetical protein
MRPFFYKGERRKGKQGRKHSRSHNHAVIKTIESLIDGWSLESFFLTKANNKLKPHVLVGATSNQDFGLYKRGQRLVKSDKDW